jgi:hypothetical protein
MKTLRIDLSHLHNEEHFQFNTEFKDLVLDLGAVAIDIETLFLAYMILYAQEEEALQVIRRSVTTEQLILVDTERDQIFSGLVSAVKSGLKHFNPESRLAASRLKIVLDQYGNVARESYDEETADCYKLVKEAQSTYADAIATLGLTDWIVQLNNVNQAFESLMKSRYSEEASKTEYRMKQTRLASDASLRTISKQIDALILVNGPTKYEAFVREFNARVEKYKLIIAQREGRNAKDDDES